MSTTSLKLSPELKARATEAARARGISTHAFLLDAVERETAREELRQSVVRESLDARRAYRRDGEYLDWSEVRDNLRARVRGEQSNEPSLRRKP